jgi:ketosteroid isomerase-like protein
MSEPREVVQRFVDAINAADDQAMTDLLHDDFVDRNPNPLQGTGKEAFANKIRQLPRRVLEPAPTSRADGGRG